MIALDTNVLVRAVTRDDPDQARVAAEVLRGDELWVSKTVLLELEWVLRYSYDLDRLEIHDVLGKLLGLRQLRVEDRGAILRARTWYAQGMDFADALHLASSLDAERLVTFDRRFANAAERIGDAQAVVLLEVPTER